MPLDLFAAIGGPAKCREISEALYARVAGDPILRPFFPGKSMRCAVEQFAAFLVQFLGGPAELSQERWWLSLRESHLRFEIGPKQRTAWLENMGAALREVEMDSSMRSALAEFFEESSAYLINNGDAASAGMATGGEIGRRWAEQRALDDAVAAVRRGDVQTVAALVQGPLLQARFARSRSTFAHFAGLLIGSGHATLAHYAREILAAHPDLARARYAGRTLMHAAAAAGDEPIVAMLLGLGVHADVLDRGGHTPLYAAANECCSGGGGAVVRVLLGHGAAVDACEGVQRCTALHMAARRGNVEIAEALLEGDAQLEARDRLGDTPLRRAVNCGQVDVAALLLSKGADRQALGSKGKTPQSAARSGAMRELLNSRRS